MLRRRICYGLALIAALLFQIFYDRYLARFVLAGVVCLPVLSLLLALPGALGLRLKLTEYGTENRRSSAGQWRFFVEQPAFFPVSRLVLDVRFHNALTGQTGQERIVYDRSAGKEQRLPVCADHCGLVTCRVTRARALDCLGLFFIPVRRPAPAAVLVLPVPAAAEKLPAVEPGAAPAGPAVPGGTPGGDYELREYRAGDLLRSIHWKLSTKRDEPVVREWLAGNGPRAILVADRFGTPEQLDRMLDCLLGLSEQLLKKDCPHIVQWETEEELRSVLVTDRRTLLDCFNEMLSEPAPLRGRPLRNRLPQTGDIPCVYITAGEETAV